MDKEFGNIYGTTKRIEKHIMKNSAFKTDKMPAANSQPAFKRVDERFASSVVRTGLLGANNNSVTKTSE